MVKRYVPTQKKNKIYERNCNLLGPASLRGAESQWIVKDLKIEKNTNKPLNQ